MKTYVIVTALAALALTSLPAGAQTGGAAGSGINGAESVLRAKGDAKGADRIARARCFSGIGRCTPKFAGQRARAMKRAKAKD